MDRASEGLRDRLKKVTAISELGRGMDLGSLNQYATQIALYLLLKVFRREINNSERRTRQDLIEMTAHILGEMKLEGSQEQQERLVDGVLYSGDPRDQASFSSMLFDERERTFREYQFRYLIPDREASNWEEGGSTVYMLSQPAQEIIFITREVLEEFGFDLEQFYTLQLIKNGNFKEAKGSVSNLIARVRNLIKKEKDWREDILRNPSLIFSAREGRRKKTAEELKEQFTEEKQVFDDMFSWKQRLNSFSRDRKQEGELLFEELERARALHDHLAELAISNIALEMEIRTDNPDIFWKTSRTTFKKDIWQDLIVKRGLPEVSLFEDLLGPLFSPEQGFIFPLEWAWGEQQLYRYDEQPLLEDEPPVEEEPLEQEVDWELILTLWEPVFEELREQGKYSVSRLNQLTPQIRQQWLAQPKNLELFMMFIITETELVEIEEEFPGLDERLLLYNRLLDRNPQLEELQGKRITAELEPANKPVNLGREFQLSPYVLYLEEE